MFVFLQRRLNSVRHDVEKRDLQEMLDQPIPTDSSESEGEYSESNDNPT